MEAASAPPACVPRGASSAAFCFEAYTRREPLRGSRSVKIKFLGRRFRVVLIERLDQVGPAVDALSGGERDRETAMDGEFDLVARAGRSCQRMALLTMLPVGGTTLFSFHLPTLFAGWRRGGGGRTWRLRPAGTQAWRSSSPFSAGRP